MAAQFTIDILYPDGIAMIRSMTSFASVESVTPFGTLGFELRSVNHRYLEISARLPEELRAIESTLRERLTARLGRGKVDISLRFRARVAATELNLDRALLSRLGAVASELAKELPNLTVNFTDLLAWPGVLQEQGSDAEGIKSAALELFERAIADLLATREREGERIAAYLDERLTAIAKVVAVVREFLPEIQSGLRARLEARLADLKQPLDPGRFEQELVLQLQRLDVDEELDRLNTHVIEARRILSADETAGRRLDFLLQEFNREANTLGSKSVDSRSTQAAVELKVLIEQMREQVQNIE
jgi:uncharacterized protein (TIGR00255 family)